MRVVELHWPGTWIVSGAAGGMTKQEAWEATGLLHLMEHRLFEAALALDAFDRFRETPPVDSKVAWAERGHEIARIREQLRAEDPDSAGGMSVDLPRDDKLDLRARRVYLRRRVAAGELPEQYVAILPAMGARSFILALDFIGKAAREIEEKGGPRSAVQACLQKWAQQFPHLTAVRNTVAHEEERIQERGPHGKPITVKPVRSGHIVTDGGALFLDMLQDNRFGCTLSSGDYGEVEVSDTSLEAARELVQCVLDAMNWKGPEQYHPDR